MAVSDNDDDGEIAVLGCLVEIFGGMDENGSGLGRVRGTRAESEMDS